MLKEYGLKENEIKIYLYLVGKNRLTAYKIAKELKINRSTCYDTLNRLISKGFVSKRVVENKDYYLSKEINSVLSQLKSKEIILKSLVSEIEKLQKNSELSIREFEGVEGRKQFNLNLFKLAQSKKVFSIQIIGNNLSPTKNLEIFIEKLLQEAKNKKLKIDYRAIWETNFKKSEIVTKFNKLGKNKFLKKIPSKVATLIYGDCIAFLFLSEKPHVVEIKNNLICQEMKSYFNHLWGLARSD